MVGGSNGTGIVLPAKASMHHCPSMYPMAIEMLKSPPNMNRPA